MGYVPRIRLRVCPLSDSLSDIWAFPTLAIKELLKFNSKDTGVSPLRILSKSISELAKRFEACP